MSKKAKHPKAKPTAMISQMIRALKAAGFKVRRHGSKKKRRTAKQKAATRANFKKMMAARRG